MYCTVAVNLVHFDRLFSLGVFMISPYLMVIFYISMSSKVECVNCHQIVAMDSRKMHEDVCGGGGGLSATLDESYRYCRQCCGDL